MQYDPKDLKKLQQIEIDILQEIIRVCEENQLSYISYAGTTLGALRHNGFIPWDDDIDIAMMRGDYEKFLEIAPKCLKKGYVLQHFSVDPNTPAYFAKVRKDGTEFVEEWAKKLKIHQGIFVDIMPLDKAPDGELEISRYCRKASIWKELYVAKTVTKIAWMGVGGKSKRFFLGLVRKIIHALLLPVSKKWIFEKFDHHLRQYNDQDTRNAASRGMLTTVCDYNDYFPGQKHVFENIEIMIPANADRIMRSNYGDYMRLPPEGKRIQHRPYRLKLE